MIQSLVEMPSFTLREEGTIHQVDDETARAWVAAGLAAPAPDEGPETASIAGGAEKAVQPRGQRKRG